MYEQIIGAAAQAIGGSGSGGGGTGGNPHVPISGQNNFNITPVGLNLGSILSPFNDGNQNTGGYATQFLSRLGFSDAGSTGNFVESSLTSPVSVSNPMPLLIAAGMIGIFIIARRKRG